MKQACGPCCSMNSAHCPRHQIDSIRQRPDAFSGQDLSRACAERDEKKKTKRTPRQPSILKISIQCKRRRGLFLKAVDQRQGVNTCCPSHGNTMPKTAKYANGESDFCRTELQPTRVDQMPLPLGGAFSRSMDARIELTSRRPWPALHGKRCPLRVSRSSILSRKSTTQKAAAKTN